jgi:putative tricarboxylic transport membrane protein
MQALLDQPRNARRWLLVAAVALATTVVTYYVFEAWLLVLLPRGRWTDF